MEIGVLCCVNFRLLGFYISSTFNLCIFFNCSEKNGLSKAKSFLLHLGMVASNQDCFYLQKLCQAVFVRSASLSAAGLAAVLTQIADIQKQPKLKINVAVDGVLFTEQKQ